MKRRILPIAAIIIGARVLIGNFVVATAERGGFFENPFVPIALILVIGGAYFLLKDDD